jgi:YHS domain-containing protein
MRYLFLVCAAAQAAAQCTKCVDGVVLGGFDVVNYFTSPGAAGVAGSTLFTSTLQNYTYHFSSAANKATFDASPSKYVPAWGGFCAWGIAREGCDNNPSPDCEPNWPWKVGFMGPPAGPDDGCAVVSGRLMCAINKDFLQKFQGLGAGGISDADTRWKLWYGGLDAGPINTGCYQGPSTHVCKDEGKPFPNRTGTCGGTCMVTSECGAGCECGPGPAPHGLCTPILECSGVCGQISDCSSGCACNKPPHSLYGNCSQL